MKRALHTLGRVLLFVGLFAGLILAAPILVIVVAVGYIRNART